MEAPRVKSIDQSFSALTIRGFGAGNGEKLSCIQWIYAHATYAPP